MTKRDHDMIVCAWNEGFSNLTIGNKPKYKVDIDFGEASEQWLKNKVKMEGGYYVYKPKQVRFSDTGGDTTRRPCDDCRSMGVATWCDTRCDGCRNYACVKCQSHKDPKYCKYCI